MTEEETTEQACKIIGKLILVTSRLDNQITNLLIAFLELGESPYLGPIFNTLDSSRKIEILKTFAIAAKKKDWVKPISKYAKSLEEINSKRNIAAHSLLTFVNGEAVLSPPSAAKIFRSIDIETKSVDRTNIDELTTAIAKANELYADGVKLIELYKNRIV